MATTLIPSPLVTKMYIKTTGKAAVRTRRLGRISWLKNEHTRVDTHPPVRTWTSTVPHLDINHSSQICPDSKKPVRYVCNLSSLYQNHP